MKIRELEKKDRFEMNINQDNSKEPELIYGTFIGTDGMYAKVQLDNIPIVQNFINNVEVTKIKKDM